MGTVAPALPPVAAWLAAGGARPAPPTVAAAAIPGAASAVVGSQHADRGQPGACIGLGADDLGDGDRGLAVPSGIHAMLGRPPYR